MSNLNPGDSIADKYKVVKILGSSQTSTVYLCRENKVENYRAVKEIWGGTLPEERKNIATQQFERELDLLKTLEDSGIPRFIDGFTLGEWHYLVVEYIEGKTLAELRKERGKPIDIPNAVIWAIQICRTLHYLHNRNSPIVYRDLQPSHIMIAKTGAVKLIDFGLARFYDDFKTKDTYVLGTYGYAAPEQYGKGQTTPKADIYALGATLYELLTLEDITQFAFDFPPLRKINKEVPPWLEKLIMQCLEEKPGKRPVSVFLIRERLEKGYKKVKGKLSPG